MMRRAPGMSMRAGRRACRSLATTVVALGVFIAAPPDLSAGDAAVETVRPPSAFALLSPGNQIIARALYDAQACSHNASAGHWSLERIARASTGGRNWGDAFMRMHKIGLFTVNGLSEIVFTYQKPRILKAADSPAEQSGPSSVTTWHSETGKRQGDEAVSGSTDSPDADVLPVGNE